MDTKTADPKGLIRESYRIDGITAGECRSIFLDWAISVPMGVDTLEQVRFLLGLYGAEEPDHPMTETLNNALKEPARTGRRGGRAARVGSL
ncbi:MAG: hypothetical protein AAGI10_02990 [Pseudomonadota bacterium]